jgi:opacity protein-like surface antigen
MTIQIARSSIGVAMGLALSLMAQSAAAADWGSGSAGGIKDYGGAGGVPVPAPVPIPDYAPSWYFRLDAGIGMVSDPDFTESGYTYGDIVNGRNGYPGVGGPVLQDLDPTWFTSDFSNLSTFGAGVGYYLGGGWRLDATIEKRSNDQAYIQGSETWDSFEFFDHDANPATNDIYTSDTNGNGIADRRTTLTVSDRIDIDGTVWMANMYYDLASRRGFTPYIGAGIGFVWNEFERTHTTTLESCDNENPCGGSTTEYTATASTDANKISLAAAAMAGFSYDISDITAVDVGYRYLFLGGTDLVMGINGVESRVSIGDQHVHQVRAGLRFNVN